jgi:hypothetical protein
MDAPKIPVRETAFAAWRILLGNFGAYLRLSWPPFAIILAANAAMAAAGSAASVPELLRHLLGIFADWAIWLVMIPVATAWSRLAGGRKTPALAFGRAERDYLWRYLALILLLFCTTAIPGRLSYGLGHELRATIGFAPLFMAQAAIYPVFLAGLAVVMRCALVLPAAAAGQPLRLRDSWSLVRRNELAVAGVLILASLPVLPVQFTMALAVDGIAAGSLAGTLTIALRKTVVLWLVWPVWAAALALLHARLTSAAQTPTRGRATGDAAAERAQ